MHYMQELLDKLAGLQIPSDQYAIYGSGPLAIRGIRESRDLDVVVKDEYYRTLIQKYPEKEKGKIEMNNGKIEIFPAWNSLLDDPEEVIDRAESIEGFKFVLLKDIIEWKRKMGREKDSADIELINNYYNFKNNF